MDDEVETDEQMIGFKQPHITTVDEQFWQLKEPTVIHTLRVIHIHRKNS